MADKLYPDAAAALDGLLTDDMLIASGGFGLCGNPENLITAIAEVLFGRTSPSGRLTTTWQREAFVRAVPMDQMSLRAGARAPGHADGAHQDDGQPLG